MRSASAERIFFYFEEETAETAETTEAERPRDRRDHKDQETERPREDTNTPLSATSLWSLRSQGLRVPKSQGPKNLSL